VCGNAAWMMAVFLNPAETGLNINCWVFGSQVGVGAIWQNIHTFCVCGHCRR